MRLGLGCRESWLNMMHEDTLWWPGSCCTSWAAQDLGYPGDKPALLLLDSTSELTMTQWP